MPDNILMDSITMKRIRDAFGASVIDVRAFRGEITVAIARDNILNVLWFLKERGGERFDYLADLCGADYPEREERFDVIYHLLNMKTGQRIRVKTCVAEGQSVPSATVIWEAANWMEREAYDMYGIHFTGHPNLTRILMFDGFEGHPLRKDFPVKGTEPPEKRYAADDKRRTEE